MILITSTPNITLGVTSDELELIRKMALFLSHGTGDIDALYKDAQTIIDNLKDINYENV